MRRAAIGKRGGKLGGNALCRASGLRHRSLVLLLLAVAGLLAMTDAASAAPSAASAWGRGTSGQLGNGFEFSSNVPVAVNGLSEVEAVSAGGFDSMALLEDGTVKAWGANGFGQLGNGTTSGSDVPVTVSGLGSVTAIASGFAHNLALLEDGTVKAWGYNEHGQLGNNTTTNSDVPVTVSGLGNVIAISAYGHESLALLSNGTVKVWGQGALGNGSLGTSKVPVTVSGLSSVEAIAAGEFFNLALLEDGTVMAWGTNQNGDVGDGSNEERLTPVAVCAVGESAGCPNHLEDVVAIAAGGRHALALRENGTVVAWGFNSFGALGDGTTTTRKVPVVVSGLSNVETISIGDFHGLALLEDGTAMAWGWNGEGRLGNPSAGEESHVPVVVSGFTEGTAIAAGPSHSLAVGAAPLPLPQIEQVTPEYGPGGGGTSASITGINFTEASAVKFGATDATGFTLNSPTSITATAPPGTGTVDVEVTTPVGTSPVSSEDTFRYSPTVSAIAPKIGYPAGGTSVTITGTNFSEVAAVKFGSTNAASFTVDSASQITAVSPPGTGTVDVVVETQGGSSPAHESDHFTYNATPVIESVTPNYGPPAGGTHITIKGSNFTGATAVKFGTQAAASFTVQSPTEITATTPPFGGGGDGVVGIFVTTPNGTNSFNGCGTEERAFIYEPTITSIEPSSGPTTGGTEVTIHGVAFESVIWGEEPLCTLAIPVLQGVRFGSTAPSNINLISGTEMTAVAPPGSGTVHITLRYPGSMGTSPTSPSDQFTYSGSSGDPVIESESVSGLSATNATLEAEIDPGNLEVGAYYQFQLVSEPSEYASEILCPTNLPPTTDGCNGTQSVSALPIGFIPGGSEPSSVSLDLSSAGVTLAPGTTYHYRVLAARRIATEDTIEWEAPAVSGEDKEFTTPPAIISESATNVTQHNATLGAQINPGDAPAGAYYQFQLAKNPADFASEFTCPTEGFPAGSSLCLGITPQQGALPIRSIPAGTADQPVSLDLEGVGATLEPGTTYYYRVIAARIVPTEDTTQWEEPTVFGADQTFTTPTPIPIQSCPFSGCPGNPGNGSPAARCKKGHVKRHGKCVKKHRHHKHRKHKKEHRHQR